MNGSFPASSLLFHARKGNRSPPLFSRRSINPPLAVENFSASPIPLSPLIPLSTSLPRVNFLLLPIPLFCIAFSLAERERWNVRISLRLSPNRSIIHHIWDYGINQKVTVHELFLLTLIVQKQIGDLIREMQNDKAFGVITNTSIIDHPVNWSGVPVIMPSSKRINSKFEIS